MLEYRPIKAIVEIKEIIKPYQERIENLNNSITSLQNEKVNLSRVCEESLLKKELGESGNIKDLTKRLSQINTEVAETEQRIDVLTKAFKPENISLTIPQITELMAIAKKEIEELGTLCDEEAAKLEEQLILIKQSFLDVITNIGRLNGVKYCAQKDFAAIQECIETKPDVVIREPVLQTIYYESKSEGVSSGYDKPWVINSEGWDNHCDKAFNKGLEEVKLQGNQL